MKREEMTLIGSGRQAEFLTYSKERAVKLFFTHVSVQDIQQEYENTLLASKTGLPMAHVGELIETNGRRGIIMEQIKGDALIDHLATKPGQLEGHAQIMARLHAAIHSHKGTGLRRQRDFLEGRIKEAQRVSPAVKSIALQLLDSLPDGDCLCHGDFHPANIILGENGPAIIDWMDARQGNPAADVAQSAFLLDIATLPSEMPALMRNGINDARETFCKLYLEQYCQLQNMALSDINAWKLPIAVAQIDYYQLDGEQQKINLLIEHLMTTL